MVTGNTTASLWDAGNIYLDKVTPSNPCRLNFQNRCFY